MGQATPEEAIDRTAWLLPSLHGPALTLMRARRSSPVEVYLRLQTEARAADLRTENALAFRTRFNGYYGVRRNAAWRAEFYAHFEYMKGLEPNPKVLFEGRLRALYGATGRVEASFISKAVATLHPASPVIDKVLRDRFASLVAAPAFGRGVDEALAYYAWLSAVMTGLAATAEARDWVGQFDAAFTDVAGAAAIHPVKKLDFLLWGGRALPLR